MRNLNLPLRDSPYTIHIASSLLDNSELLNSYCQGENVLIVTNDVVAPLWYDRLKSKLVGKNIHHIIIKDGEIHKSKESLFTILDYLIEHGFRRNDTLFALGGGVIGDLSGFAAASFQRGMNLVQVPTTLLSQVDSSVGGKTAINHPLGKNLIGAFYQPKAVIIDVSTLSSLPDREYFSGFGEVVKYALLGEHRILNLLTSSIDKIIRRDEDCLKEIIYLSCQKKADVVFQDEKEAGLRALLNLGHTFAHALETLTQYKHYLHGEAVSIGMLMAMSLSHAKGLIASSMVEDYRALLESLRLPTQIKVKIDIEAFLKTMKKDKKNQTDAYRLVLVKPSGCILQEETDRPLLIKVIREYIA